MVSKPGAQTLISNLYPPSYCSSLRLYLQLLQFQYVQHNLPWATNLFRTPSTQLQCCYPHENNFVFHYSTHHLILKLVKIPWLLPVACIPCSFIYKLSFIWPPSSVSSLSISVHVPLPKFRQSVFLSGLLQ